MKILIVEPDRGLANKFLNDLKEEFFTRLVFTVEELKTFIKKEDFGFIFFDSLFEQNFYGLQGYLEAIKEKQPGAKIILGFWPDQEDAWKSFFPGSEYKKVIFNENFDIMEVIQGFLG